MKSVERFLLLEKAMVQARQEGQDENYEILKEQIGEVFLDMIVNGGGDLSLKERQNLRDTLINDGS